MKPHIFTSEDGSVVIEWIAKDRRFALWLGGEPCWTYVNKDGTIESGELTSDVITVLKQAKEAK